MKKFRKCDSSKLYTGISKCAPDFAKMKAAIIVKAGTKLPAALTADKLEELVHADRSKRVYGIVGFCEYAKGGAEVQTAANGYGPEQVTGVSARKDTFDLDKYYPELDAALMRTVNTEFDVYFIDEDNYLHGTNDGTDVLAGYPMSSIYGEASPIPTSSNKASMQVVFCHKDAKYSKINFDYNKLDFKINNLVLGILPVLLEKTEAESGTEYRILESVGYNDITSIYGPLIATAGADVITGTTSAVTYNDESETLTIVTAEGAVPRLKVPSVLYDNDIKGIEQV